MNALNLATADEKIEPNQVPTHEQIGRQLKRRRIAESLVESGETTAQDVGQRETGLVSLALQNLTGNIDPNQVALVAVIAEAVANAINLACQPNGAISNAINNAIDRACQPNGAVANAIDRACQPNGAVANAIDRACQPNGAISNAINNAIDRACQPNGAVANAIDRACQPNGAVFNLVTNTFHAMAALQNARTYNQAGISNDHPILPLPNPQNELPRNFPATVGDFWRLDREVVNVFLVFYSLPLDGNARTKKNRLAAYCHIMVPV